MPNRGLPINVSGAPENHDALVARMIALAARNGVEDLHASGAFSDRQAPALNRRIRGRIYEMLAANRLRDARRDNDPFSKYVNDLEDQGKRPFAGLRGAVGRAVDDFAVAEAIDPDTAAKLKKEAIKGAVEAWRTSSRLSLGRSKDEEKDSFAVNWWLRCIPDYWEEPEVSADFQKLLDSIEVQPR
jgi:hypothetical protein